MTPTLIHYLVISTLFFGVGLTIILARKSIIAILLGIELLLNAGAINFAAYSRFVTGQSDGQIFSLFIIMIAAAEAAVILAIVIRLFQNRDTVHVDETVELRH